MKQTLLLTLALTSISLIGGTLPDSLRTDWSSPGMNETVSPPNAVVSFLDFGGINDSSADNSAAFIAAVASFNGQGGVICIPEGKYLFKSTMRLPSNVIVKGEGSNKTKLFFDLNRNGDCIVAQGTVTALKTAIVSGYQKDSKSVDVASGSGFSPGDYAFVKQDGNTLMDPNSTWAFPYFYQIVKITGITDNHVSFEKPLRLSFQASLNPVLVRIVPVKNAGVECLSLTRLDTTSYQTSNIFFQNAANCWVKGVESFNTNFGHIVLESSAQCTVSGNYVHHSFKYGGGGQAYGIVLQLGASDNFIHDNILRHLRHSILLQAAANGNVVAYNYSREPHWQELPLPGDAAGDIVLHGNYNFTNLFEGNTCQNIIIDNSHHTNGPFNTFFRNRAEYYGIIMNAGAGDRMNFIANETTNTNFLLGNFSLTGSNFIYGNNQHGIVIPGGTGNTPESTLIGGAYHSEIGLPNGIGSKRNAAHMRWGTANAQKTICEGMDYCGVSTAVRNFRSDLSMQVFPNPSSGIFNFTLMNLQEDASLDIYNMNGQLVHSLAVAASPQQIEIDLNDLAKGQYIAVMRTTSAAVSETLIIQ